MAETKAALHRVQSALRKYGTLPILESAQILSGPHAKRAEVLLTSTVRDFDQDAKRRVTTFKSVSNNPRSDQDDGFEWSTEEKDDYVSSAAHEYVEGQKIVFRSCAGKEAAKKRHFVERWSRSALLDSLEVTSKHGPFYTDSTFGGVAFHSKITSRLAYIAEAKKPDDDSFNKFEYQDEWGETFTEKSAPVVIVLDFENPLAGPKSDTEESQINDENGKDPKSSDPADEDKGKTIVLNPPENTSCGPVVFGPDEGKVAWVATSTTPRRYGIAICPNRRSTIMYSNYDGSDSQELTKEYAHARSPILGGDENLYFLTNPLGGAHYHTSELHKYDFQSKKCSRVVAAPQKSTDNGFTGIYSDRLSYAYDDKVITNSFCRNTNRPFLLSTKHSNAIDVIPSRKPEDSWVIVGAGKGQLLLSRTGPDGETEVLLRNLQTEATISIASSAAPSENLLISKTLTYAGKPLLESILLLPGDFSKSLFATTNSSKPPLIVFPHGGPHGAFTTRFDPWVASLLDLGIAVLCVNYSGSTGYGKDGIESLIGRIGDLDVSDVQFAKDEALKSGLVDENRVCAMGGSHGGFLTAWLVGKYPEDYKCGVLRNPVTDLGSCGAGSDIPDWACAEAGIKFDLDRPPLIASDVYKKLWEASPMSVAENVRAPVLMAIGGKDQRVPPYQGLNWIKFLRSRGHKNARCFIYSQDGHRLDSGDAFKFGFEAIAMFLKEFL